MILDSGIESILKCWNILSSHDTPRIKNLIPDPELRKIALILQFTLPGAPVIYYGEELGMSGKDDPCNRGPMEWNLVNEENEYLKFYKKLIDLKKKNISLQYGDFLALDTSETLAFCRQTNNLEDLIVVIVNPGEKEVREIISIPEYRLMNWEKMEDKFSGNKFSIFCGLINITIPPKSCYILSPIIPSKEGYSPYKRIK